MKVIVCIDERGGVCFHGRRVSQDRQQREDVLIHYGDEGLLMKESASRLYGINDSVTVIQDWKEELTDSRWWVAEDTEFLCWKDQLEELVIYKWNRTYPFDEKLSVPLDRQIWKKKKKRQFSGSSHEKIDVEHYIKRR